MIPNPQQVLKKLSRYPCGDLFSIAKKILAGERHICISIKNRSVYVPIQIFKRKSKTYPAFVTCCQDARRNDIQMTVFLKDTEGKNDLIQILIHELRHVQQFLIIKTKFCKQENSFPFEVDACAAVMACLQQVPDRRFGDDRDTEIIKQCARLQACKGN